jgi:hypothetical protein
MAAREQDPLGAQPPGGDHRAQTDRTVPDDQHRVTAADAGGDRAVVAGGHHIGQRQQRRQQRGVGGHRQLDQGAVRVRHANRLALTAVDPVESVPAAVAAGDVQPLGAVVAGVVAVGEGGDDQVAGLQAGHVRTGLLDDAEELVSHGTSGAGGGHGPVGPQVAAAHTGRDRAHDGIGGVHDLRIGPVLDADIAGSIHHCGTHEGAPNVGRVPPLVAADRTVVSVRACAVRLRACPARGLRRVAEFRELLAGQSTASAAVFSSTRSPAGTARHVSTLTLFRARRQAGSFGGNDRAPLHAAAQITAV